METFYNHTEPRDVDADAYAPAGLVSVRDLLAFRPDDVTAVVSGPQPVSIFYGPERVGKTLAITELAYRFALECAMPTVVIIGQNKNNSSSVCDDMNARRHAIVTGPTAVLPSFEFVDGSRDAAGSLAMLGRFLNLETIPVVYAGDAKPLEQLAFDQTGFDMMNCGKPILNRKRNRDSELEPDRARAVLRRRVGDDGSRASTPDVVHGLDRFEYDLRDGARPNYDEREIAVPDVGTFTKDTPLSAYPGKTLVLRAAQKSWVFSRLGAEITAKSVMHQGATNIHSSFSNLSKKNFLVQIGRSGRAFAYRLANPDAPFPTSF